MKYKSMLLGDVCNITSSKRIFAKEYQTHGIPFYRGKEVIEKSKGNSVSTELFISEERFAEIKSKYETPQKGDILLTSVGTLGVPWLVDEADFYFKDGNLTWLRSNDVLLNKYLYLWLASSEAQMQIDTMCIGSTQKALTIETLKKFQISLPTLENQQKICDMVYPIMDKIALNNKINENLQQQAQSIYYQWMIDNVGKYKIEPLSEVAEINPDTYSAKEQWRYVNYLDTSSVTNGLISELQYIEPSNEKLPSRAKRKLLPNDIVFSTVRPNQRHFGIISNPMSNMLASTGFAVIRSKHPRICNELIYLCLTENKFIDKMQQIAEQSTSTFPSIKPSDLAICEIPCPAESVSTGLTKILQSLFALISANQSENRTLTAIRDTLLPKLMSGEIDVKNIGI